jgi:DNA-directed RNA polymerase specialized sigma24 family protein
MRSTGRKTVIERTAQEVTAPRADGSGILTLMASPHDLSRLLQEWANGAPSALEALRPLVHGELWRLAASYMRRESSGQMLQPTALAHEWFLRLVGRAPDCKSFVHLDPDREPVVSRERDADLVVLDEALAHLAGIDPRKAHAVEMRFFGGLSVQESAEVLNVSEATVRRDCQFAEPWLLRELSGEKGDGS